MKINGWPWALFISMIFAHGIVNAQFSRQQASNILINAVVGVDSLNGHYFFSRFEKMAEGDTLWLEGNFGFHVCTYPEQWVFFVDDLPLANWAHPCRIIFFNSMTGAYEMLAETWPPQNYTNNPTQSMLDWEWILSVSVLSPAIHASGDLLVCPNPFRDYIRMHRLNDKQKISSIELLNSKGVSIFYIQINENDPLPVIDGSALPPGIYFLKAKEKDGRVSLSKLVRK